MSSPRRGRDSQFDEMDAVAVIRAVRDAGGDLAPGSDEDGIRLLWCADVPRGLLARAKELEDEIQTVLVYCPMQFCASCLGTAFYRADGRWHCFGCEGMPEEGPAPERWMLTHPDPGDVSATGREEL